MDTVTWQALTAVLTLGGFGLSAWVWRRRGAASGLRGVAWSLLPLAAYLTGTLQLVWEIGGAVVDYALGLTLNPLVWAGVAVLSAAVVLFVVSGVLLRRRDTHPAPARQQRAATRRAVPPSGADEPTDEMGDIQAILNRHNIS